MKGQTRILQQGIEPLPVEGRKGHAGERIGCQQNKGQKRRGNGALNPQNPSQKALRQAPTK